MSAVRGRFVQCGHFADKREDLQMRATALFGAKNSGFLEIYGVSERKKGVNFSQFCADVINGRPLKYYLVFIVLKV